MKKISDAAQRELCNDTLFELIFALIECTGGERKENTSGGCTSLSALCLGSELFGG